LHVGDILFNHVEFFRFTEFILEKPNRLVLLNGDIINNNLTNSAGSPFDDIISPNDQKKEAKRMLLPIRERIKACTGGNHEGRTKQNAGLDVTEEMAEALGVPYNEDEVFVKFMIGKRPNAKKFIYTLYMTHGNGGGRRPGNKLNNLEDLSKNILADIYVVGHGHARIGHKPIFRYPDLRNNKIVEMEQLFTMSAGWLKYGGYPVRKMMRPQVRGAHPITISGTHKEATTTI
jgi:predicted phosphodiesterase